MKKAFQFLFGFSGRISRTKYALGTILGPILVLSCFLTAFFMAVAQSTWSNTFLVLGLLATPFMILSNFSFAIRRLYDLDYSARWIFALWLSATAAAFPLFMPAPSHQIITVFYFTLSVSCYWLPTLFLLFWPGTPRANRFGANPSEKNPDSSVLYPLIGEKIGALLRFSGRIRRKRFVLIQYAPLCLAPLLFLLPDTSTVDSTAESFQHSLDHLGAIATFGIFSGYMAACSLISICVILMMACFLFSFISLISLPIQRLHDCNRSGKWVIVLLILNGLLMFYTSQRIAGLSEYSWSTVLCWGNILPQIPLLALTLYLILKRGTAGANKYGADPRENSSLNTHH